MNQQRSQELADTLVEYGVQMAMGMMAMKMMAEIRRNYPDMFWDMVKAKHSNMIFNCRM